MVAVTAANGIRAASSSWAPQAVPPWHRRCCYCPLGAEQGPEAEGKRPAWATRSSCKVWREVMQASWLNQQTARRWAAWPSPNTSLLDTESNFVSLPHGTE